MKKFTALAISLAMILGLFAGCGKSNETEDSKLSISVFYWDLDNLGGDSDTVYKKLAEKFNCEFEPVSATYAQWREKLNLLFASGEVPDWFICAGTEDVQFKKWIKEGFLCPISDYVTEEKYPNLYHQLNMYKDITKLTGGKHYGLPLQNGEPNENGIINKHGFWIRKDWVKKLNLSLPTSTDELYAVAKAFSENDPDGDGKRDTYGLTSNGIWWMYPLMNAFDTSYYSFKQDESGKWQPEAINANMKSAVEYLHKMYAENILDPDFVVNTEDQVYEKFITGKIGIFPGGMGVAYNKIYDKFKSAYPNTDPSDYFTYLEVLKGPDGKRRIDGNLAWYCMSCIRGDVSDAKRERILEIMEYMLTDEGTELVEYGIEGEHFKKENGKYVSLLGKDVDGKELTLAKAAPASRLGNLSQWRNYKITDSVPNKEEVEKSLESPRKYAIADPLKYIEIDESVVPQHDKKTLGDLTLQSVVSMVMSKSGDITSEFDAYVKKWKDSKGTVYIDEVNRAANAQK